MRERHVRLDPEPDGMATLSAYLPAAQAVAAYGVVNDYARRAGDDPAQPRTMDARRADAFYDLITQPPDNHPTDPRTPDLPTANAQAPDADPGPGAEPGAEPGVGTDADLGAGAEGADSARADTVDGDPVRAEPAVAHTDRRQQAHARARTEIRVTVPLSTLLGGDELSGELAGYGPIPAPIARELAADPNSTWRRLVTDPQTGALLDYGMTRYRPPPSLAGFLNARAVTCVRPGCRMPAEHCDLDHHEPHDPERQRGPTNATQMDPLCRPDHLLKQLPGWKVVRNPDGTVTWTLPTGHTITRHPLPVGETITSSNSLDEPEDPDEPPF